MPKISINVGDQHLKDFLDLLKNPKEETILKMVLRSVETKKNVRKNKVNARICFKSLETKLTPKRPQIIYGKANKNHQNKKTKLRSNTRNPLKSFNRNTTPYRILNKTWWTKNSSKLETSSKNPKNSSKWIKQSCTKNMSSLATRNLKAKVTWNVKTQLREASVAAWVLAEKTQQSAQNTCRLFGFWS